MIKSCWNCNFFFKDIGISDCSSIDLAVNLERRWDMAFDRCGGSDGGYCDARVFAVKAEEISVLSFILASILICFFF